MQELSSYLFQTEAVKICPENKPFWLTSGNISPYFINTHYIYGSKASAENLLQLIEDEKDNKLELPKRVFEETLKQYNDNKIYNDVITQMIEFIKKNIDISEIDYISGGERRDWFFSNMVAYLLEKPHISIFKDLSCIVSNSTFEINEEIKTLENKKILHIADLITVAASYERAWIPAIESLGSKILWSIACVDRMQGGEKALKEYGIKSLSMIKIDLDLFERALESNYITKPQLDMLVSFFNDPYNSMREFLINNPSYIENSINGADEKSKARAIICKEQNLYKL